MTEAPTRRSILRGAFQLSVLGASVPLITRRVFAREETLITPQILSAYSCWLYYKRRLLMDEMFPGKGREVMEFIPLTAGADHFHFPSGGPADGLQPSTKAALVLSAMGVDLAAVQRDSIHRGADPWSQPRKV